MNVDELFKVPKLPTGSNKRRMPDNPTPEMLKRMRMDTAPSMTIPPADATTSSTRRPRAASARDEEYEDTEEMEGDFAPGGDADYFAEEDEEGRFYGGGLTREQKDILNIFDKAGGEGVREDLDEMTLPSIRRTLLRFERAADKNQDQRSKYPDDPTKFIDSEADLDIALKAMLPLAQNPSLSYPEIVKSGTLARLIGLLSHENADIVIDVVEVIHEFTDEDVGNEAEDDEAEGSREDAIKVLMEGLLESSILELLVENLGRLKEEEESDRQGVFHILGVFENMVGFDAKLSEHLASKTTILAWLLERIQAKTYDENRGYAAELLSIILQDNRPNRVAFGNLNGVDTVLQVLSQYRRRDPRDADETEFMENLFDTLCSALGEPEVKQHFLDCEGVDLMVLMMKDKMQSRSRSIKVLDYAMSGPAGTAACETFVEALGLKTLFSVFMGKPSKKQKGVTTAPASEDTSHSLGIVSSLFTNLPSESTARIRLLAKFVENGYEKVEKLLEVRDAAQARLNVVEKEGAQEKEDMEAKGEEITQEEEDLWYLRRLDGGLFTLQTVDYILAWAVMEDDGIRAHTQKMLDRRSKSLQDIVKTLRIFHSNIDENEAPDETGMSRREILRNLMAFLEAC